jgi:hypothetical protein
MISKLALMLLMTAHWMACVWGMAGTQGPVGKTWLDALQGGKSVEVCDEESCSVEPSMDVRGEDSVLHMYLAAVHFAVMTITSIGHKARGGGEREKRVRRGICFSPRATWGGIVPWVVHYFFPAHRRSLRDGMALFDHPPLFDTPLRTAL